MYTCSLAQSVILCECPRNEDKNLLIGTRVKYQLFLTILSYYASVNSSCAQTRTQTPPPGLTPGHERGCGGLSICQIPRGGDEKRGQIPRPPSTLQHFSLIAQSKGIILSILMCDVLFQLTSFLCDSTRILITTSRRNDMHQFMV